MQVVWVWGTICRPIALWIRHDACEFAHANPEVTCRHGNDSMSTQIYLSVETIAKIHKRGDDQRKK